MARRLLAAVPYHYTFKDKHFIIIELIFGYHELFDHI